MLRSAPETRTEFREKLADLIRTRPREALELAHMWEWHGRDSQFPPGYLAEDDEERPWTHWILQAGRGFGKTRSGSEAVRIMKETIPRIALVGRTVTDAEEVMVDGPSGIVTISPPWDVPKFVRSKQRPRLEWANGSRAYLYSSKTPDSLRGPEHGGYWADELAAWYYLVETWDNLLLGLRRGRAPWGVVTTTPRPIEILKELDNALDGRSTDPRRYASSSVSFPGGAFVTYGSTYENLDNLAPPFREAILSRFEGTTKGIQEIAGRLLAEIEGALWKRAEIERNRIRLGDLPDLERIVVGVDPPGSKSSGTAGIVVVGVATINRIRHTYTLDDVSGQMSPTEWATAAIQAFEKWSADRIVAERNFGGDMVETTIRTVAQERGTPVPVALVNASRGKEVRAEPVVGLTEQGRDHHVGMFQELEDELCEWVPHGPNRSTWSPNRLDAKVWGVTNLGLAGRTSNAAPRSTAVGR